MLPPCRDMTTSRATDDADALFDEAVEHHRAGRLDAARTCFETLLAGNAGNSALHHVVGIVCYQQRDHEEAVRHLRAAIELNDDRAAYHGNLGLALTALGRHRQAVAAFRSALALQPDYPDALLNMGSAYAAQDDLVNAETQFRRLLEGRPDSAEAHYNLGVIALRQQKIESAARCFNRALELRPDYADAQISLGRMHLAAGEFERAVTFLRSALHLDPNNPDVHRMLAHALCEGDPAGSLHHARRAIELDPGNAAHHFALGCVQQSLGQLDAAERAYNKALTLDESDADALNNLGTIFRERDDDRRAIVFFRAAIERREAFADAHYNLGTVCQDVGDIDGATRSFERSIEIRPQPNPAHRCLVDLYRTTGREQLATDALDRWLELEPDSPTALHMRAAMQNADAPSRAADDFVREEFDRFARGFDKKLAQLNYCAPERLVDALRPHLRGRLACVLDAGCGTGLAAALLEPLCDRLDGVDLSANMIRQAEARDRYHRLFVDELVRFALGRRAEYDLIFSADTLVYFGDLTPFLGAAAGALRAGGHLAMSLERLSVGADKAYRLDSSGRYRHAPDYVRASLADAGFELLEIEAAVLREELNRPVDGLIVIAKRAVAQGAD